MCKEVSSLVKEDEEDKLLMDEINVALKKLVDKKCDQRVKEINKYVKKTLDKPTED